jgi:hypothetical protein
MAVVATDIKFRKSATVTDTGANGGRKSQTEVVSGSKHNLFPRITDAERIAGVTRYRKEFWSNEDLGGDTAYGVAVFLEFPSNAGDRFYLALGTQTNIQSQVAADTELLWIGCGTLNAALSGSETSVDILMENNDFDFIPGTSLHLTDKFMTSQTVDADVAIGDSVTFGGGTWSKIAATTDITYPNGIYVGGNVVLTENSYNEEFLTIQDVFTDEDIGDGNGSTTNPALTTLANNANGIMVEDGYRPVITATCGGTERTVNISATGVASGYCDAGQLNMATGVWTTDINWTTAPDAATNITATYYEYPWSYAGNVVTVKLESGQSVANAYLTTNTYVSGSIDGGDVVASFDSYVETSASGTYDETTYPIVVPNVCEEETWTLLFTSATAFTITGTLLGQVGTGTTSVDAAPTNPNNGQPYFTLDKDGWGGTWAIGDTLVFQTHPATVPLWFKEVVPAAASAADRNLLVLGSYNE